MADIEQFFTHLCDIINVCFRENLIDAKVFTVNNKDVDIESINSLKAVVEKLAEAVIINTEGKTLQFQHITDQTLRLKLLMAYLKYSLTQFYVNLNVKNMNCLNLLYLALGWLIIEKQALKCVIYNQLYSSNLYEAKVMEETFKDLENNSSIFNDIDSLIKECGKLNNYLKQISQLMTTKAKISTKLYNASEGILGLRQLNIDELAFIKRFIENKKDHCELSREYLKELRKKANVVNNFIKLNKNMTVFINWMVSRQNNFKVNSKLRKLQNNEEVFEFLNMMRKIIDTNVNNKEQFYGNSNSCSQLIKVNDDITESSNWSMKLNKLINQSNDGIRNNLHDLATEINHIFEQNCEL